MNTYMSACTYEGIYDLINCLCPSAHFFMWGKLEEPLFTSGLSGCVNVVKEKQLKNNKQIKYINKLY